MAEKTTGSIDALHWARQYLSTKAYHSLLNTIQKPLDIAIRINRLKWKSDEAVRKLKERYGWALESVPFCPDGYRVRRAETPPSTTIEHRLGYFYIMEAASMLPAELFDFTGIDKPLMLDLAASPGGKTIHMLDRTGDRGLMIANDASRSRIPALQIVLRNWGTINQAVACFQGETYGSHFSDCFNAVLVDAPCSMQGLRTLDSHAPRPITQNEINTLAARQVRLLESALRAVKTGGQVVYATCTLSPEENESVVAKILQRFPAQVVVDDVCSKLPIAAPGLEQIDEKRLPSSILNTLRIWPHLFGTAGFFAAKLVKQSPIPAVSYTHQTLPLPKERFLALSPQKCKEWYAAILDRFGFALVPVMEKQNLRLAEDHKTLYLMPALVSERFKRLPWLACGMELGKILCDGWQPSHEFVVRFGDQFQTGILVLEDEHLESWLRGEDIRGYIVNKNIKGKVLAIRDRLGRNLGRGKALEDRLKNMLPTRLF